jgi:hypothetical protein
MNNYFLKVCFVLFLIAGWTASSYAEEWVPATNLDTAWVKSSYGDGSGTVTTEEAVINMAANGTRYGGFYGALNKTETTGISGMGATLRVDQISGNCTLGLKATIGQIGDKQIQISIYLQQWDQLNSIIGSKVIQYEIQMFDMNTEEYNVVATGNFGSWDGAWVLGEPMFVAFARVGSELRFYADGFKQLHKIQMQDGIVPLYGDVSCFVRASEGADVSIAGSISDIVLYYP